MEDFRKIENKLYHARYWDKKVGIQLKIIKNY